MNKMIQIRNVPEDVHRRLKVKAAELGLSMSDLLLREATRLAEGPTLQEWFERVAHDSPVNLSREAIVEAVRAERDSR